MVAGTTQGVVDALVSLTADPAEGSFREFDLRRLETSSKKPARIR